VRAFAICLAVYFAALLWINLFFLPYPADNDLQFMGWMAEHLRLSRPESLVSRNYPFPMGFPLLMRALTPLFGSIVRAALFCQAAASALGLLLVYAITKKIFADGRAAAAAAAAAAVVNFPVAVSEFADSISAAAILVGLWLLLDAILSPRRHFLLGAMVGLAFLIRFHYLTFLLLIPAALLVLRPPARAWAACCAALGAGFLLVASPLIALNLFVYRTPLTTGLSSYIVGHNVIEAVDWNDFPATYALWPVARVLRERPFALLRTMLQNASSFLHAFALFTLALTAAGMSRSKEQRRIPGFLLIVTGGYVALDILLTRYTNRAAVPAFMFLAILAAGFGFTLQWPQKLRAAALAGIAIGVSVHAWKQVRLLEARRGEMEENRAVQSALEAHGLRSSAEVFCNDWNVYNLGHPYLEPFYDYGGYMLLDPEYAAQRPLPRGSLPRGIRFVVLVRDRPAPGLPPPAGRRIFSDQRLDVYLRGE
jgi:hypothetical protein